MLYFVLRRYRQYLFPGDQKEGKESETTEIKGESKI